jgi:transposase-like protein
MTQHFLLSAAARSLSPAKVMRMSDRGAENVFARLRWPRTDGKPVCPRCGYEICYDCRRSPETTRWRCKACRADFSVTSGTLFAWHKLPLRTYLMAIAVFCNEVKGKSMLAFCRDLDVQYKTAFVLAHKLREAMASSVKALRIGGEGREAEIDGAYFGGHIRPENLAADRIDRRLERAEQCFLNQFTLVIIGRRYRLDAHDPLGELARRHRLGGLAQLIVDQSQAFAMPEPNVACPPLPGADLLRPDVWIEQPHGRVEMRQVCFVPRELLFKLSQSSSQFRALVP